MREAKEKESLHWFCFFLSSALFPGRDGGEVGELIHGCACALVVKGSRAGCGGGACVPPATHHTEGPLGSRKEKESEWGQSFQSFPLFRPAQAPNFAFSFSQAHTCVLHTPDTRQSSLAQTSRSHLVAMRGDKVLKLAKGLF